jgi:uncharacterized integral membrane protein
METREHEFERTWQPRLWFSISLLILLAAYLIAFVIGNSDDASVNFIFAEATTSLIWVILLSVLVGLIAGVLLSQVYRRRQAFTGKAGGSDAYSSEASSETPSSITDGDS